MYSYLLSTRLTQDHTPVGLASLLDLFGCFLASYSRDLMGLVVPSSRTLLHLTSSTLVSAIWVPRGCLHCCERSVQLTSGESSSYTCSFRRSTSLSEAKTWLHSPSLAVHSQPLTTTVPSATTVVVTQYGLLDFRWLL